MPTFERLRSRKLDVVGSKAVHAYACGYDACSDAIFQGRHIDTVRSHKVYAIASECRPLQAANDDSFWVMRDYLPPHGVPRELRIVLRMGPYTDLLACFFPGTATSDDTDPSQEGCPETTLTWDSANERFTGTFSPPGLTVELWPEPATGTAVDPDGRLDWRIEFAGCQPVQRFPIFMPCEFPLILGSEGLAIYQPPLGSCCPSLVRNILNLGYDVYGWHKTCLPARHTDTIGTTKVFSTSHCCEEVDCGLADCCDCEASPREWLLTVSGITNGPGPPFPGTQCECHNGTWLLGLNSFTDGVGTGSNDGECGWVSQRGGCPVAPTSMWTLNCVWGGSGGGTWRLQSQNTPGGGGQATYELPFSEWDCLGENVMRLIFSVPSCANYPATLTLTPA